MDKISNTPNIHFGAVHLKNAQVLKCVTTAKEFPVDVSLVEMNHNNPNDKKALDELKTIWADGRFTEITCSESFIPNRKVYALTTQKYSFDNINPNKVIGLADGILNSDNLYLRFIQSNHKEYKHAGKAMLETIVENAKSFGAKTMDVFVEENIKPFYRKVFPQIKDKPCTQESSTNLILDLYSL